MSCNGAFSLGQISRRVTRGNFSPLHDSKQRHNNSAAGGPCHPAASLLLRRSLCTHIRQTPEWLWGDDKVDHFVITEADLKGPQEALTNSKFCQRLPLYRGPTPQWPFYPGAQTLCRTNCQRAIQFVIVFISILYIRGFIKRTKRSFSASPESARVAIATCS
jgi:hypothetical protein